MNVELTQDVYGDHGEILYESGTEVLGAMEDGLFVDYSGNAISRDCYKVIDPDDYQISINCDSDPNDYLHLELDDSGEYPSLPDDKCLILSVYSGTKMLGGVTFYEKSKVQELIQFLQDAIAK